MSRLNELLAELCPDGVEYKTLREIATVSRGGNFQKKDFQEEGFPCIHYGQIYTKYDLFADKTFTFISEECAKKQRKAVKNDIIMAVTSENIEDVCRCIAWLGESEVAVSGHSAIIHHNQNSKYLVYYFHSQMFMNQKRKLAQGTKVIEVAPDKLLSIRLPVPPLEVQREIVRVLDSFTLLTAELTAELTARKKQYEFYRNKLLANDEKYPMKSLSDLGKWSGGKTPSMANRSFWEKGTIPWISSKDMKASTLLDTQDHITEKAIKEASMKVHPANSIAIVTRSGILKHTFPVAYIPFEATINQDIKMLSVNEDVLPKYAFHVMQGRGKDILIKTKKQGGTVDSLDFQKVLAYKVPVPSKDIQRRLVDVLDNFDTICTDLNIGLPAEIEARQKQYEYYRDLLLTFAEKGDMLLTDGRTDGRTDRPIRSELSAIKLLQYVFGYVVLPLSSVAKVFRGEYITKKNEKTGTIPVILGGQEPAYYIDRSNHDGEIVVIARSGASAGFVSYWNQPIFVTDGFGYEEVEGLSTTKYLYYVLKNIEMVLNSMKRGAGVPHVSSEALSNIRIPLPSLEEQKRIVEILDRFDALCNDLSAGIPAEIEARQKQYEYYRDKLLNFKEVK